MKSKSKVVKAWAPDRIFLTREGYNDCQPEDGEVLWCENRITKGDIEYRRVRPISKKGVRG